MRTKTAKSREKFQSTLPTRGETLFLPPGYVYGFHFNPLSPHGERPGRDGKLGAYAGRFQSTLPTRGETPSGSIPSYGDLISIHSPHTGRDAFDKIFSRKEDNFNPLSPHGERLTGALRGPILWAISIHSPHTGRDALWATTQKAPSNFNPLSPHGERQAYILYILIIYKFQSTLPTRGETLIAGANIPPMLFQSTLPTRGETSFRLVSSLSGIFQSTLPTRGETQGLSARVLRPGKFQSTLPTRGETLSPFILATFSKNFNPLSPHGERPFLLSRPLSHTGISIHSPHTGRDAIFV